MGHTALITLAPSWDLVRQGGKRRSLRQPAVATSDLFPCSLLYRTKGASEPAPTNVLREGKPSDMVAPVSCTIAFAWALLFFLAASRSIKQVSQEDSFFLTLTNPLVLICPREPQRDGRSFFRALPR